MNCCRVYIQYTIDYISLSTPTVGKGKGKGKPQPGRARAPSIPTKILSSLPAPVSHLPSSCTFCALFSIPRESFGQVQVVYEYVTTAMYVCGPNISRNSMYCTYVCSYFYFISNLTFYFPRHLLSTEGHIV